MAPTVSDLFGDSIDSGLISEREAELLEGHWLETVIVPPYSGWSYSVGRVTTPRRTGPGSAEAFKTALESAEATAQSEYESYWDENLSGFDQPYSVNLVGNGLYWEEMWSGISFDPLDLSVGESSLKRALVRAAADTVSWDSHRQGAYMTDPRNNLVVFTTQFEAETVAPRWEQALSAHAMNRPTHWEENFGFTEVTVTESS